MTDVTAVVNALRAQMAGEVITAADASYDAARQVHNGLIDRRPVVIARCRGAADVQATRCVTAAW